MNCHNGYRKNYRYVNKYTNNVINSNNFYVVYISIYKIISIIIMNSIKPMEHKENLERMVKEFNSLDFTKPQRKYLIRCVRFMKRKQRKEVESAYNRGKVEGIKNGLNTAHRSKEYKELINDYDASR